MFQSAAAGFIHSNDSAAVSVPVVELLVPDELLPIEVLDELTALAPPMVLVLLPMAVELSPLALPQAELELWF